MITSPAPAMKSLLCLLTLNLSAHVSAQSPLLTQAKEAGTALPRGGIVIGEQTGEATPTFFTAGAIEPKSVPPEKIIFEIGSISKVFTGILLAQAVLEKKVTLDTTLRDLMGKGQTFADEHVPAITLRQLATHTSGLPRMPDAFREDSNPGDFFASYDRAKLNASIAAAKLEHAPPFASSYSNLGVGLLGDLLSRLYDKPWEELVRERITKPLGLQDTAITLSAEQQMRAAPGYAGAAPAKPIKLLALAGAGALRSTATDMLTFARALLRPETTTLCDAIKLVEEPQLDGSTGLCLGINMIGGKPGYWFQGATQGFTSWISARTVDGHLTTMLINNKMLMPETLLMRAATKMKAGPLVDYAGVYDTGVDSPRGHIFYTFEVRDQELWHQITGQPFRRLTPHPSRPDRFELKSFNVEIQFTRADGRIISTTLFQNGREIKARKLVTDDKAKR